MKATHAAHVDDELIYSDTAIVINVGWQKVVGPDSFHFSDQILGLLQVQISYTNSSI